MILFLYQPEKLPASCVRFSMSFTCGFFAQACTRPEIIPIPKNGFIVVNGAPKNEARMARGCPMAIMAPIAASPPFQRTKDKSIWPVFIPPPLKKPRTIKPIITMGNIQAAILLTVLFGGITSMSDTSVVFVPASSSFINRSVPGRWPAPKTATIFLPLLSQIFDAR